MHVNPNRSTEDRKKQIDKINITINFAKDFITDLIRGVTFFDVLMAYQNNVSPVVVVKFVNHCSVFL